MEKVYDKCCGIDVHKKLIVACFKCGKRQEIREFGATTRELLEMADWLKEGGCMMAAMESTASYWKPLYNILESCGLDAMVVNARYMKAVPGRKTDVKDAEWIAELLQHGLLQASYIPDKDQRELRELVRYRKSRVGERNRELNQLQKMLEGANIKISGTITDINGKSARNILEHILTGKQIDSAEYDVLYEKKIIAHNLKATKEQIIDDLNGVMPGLQRRMMRVLLNHLDELCGLDAMVVNARHMKAVPGRKTDVKDAEWIADLLQHGLLQASYIPDKDQRELRELIRYRKSLVGERNRELNRLQKMLEGANIKISGTITDINGKSARNILEYILTGKKMDSAEYDVLYKKKIIAHNLKATKEQIIDDLNGVMSDLQRKMMRVLLNHLDELNAHIHELDNDIDNFMKPEAKQASEAIQEIPGIGETSAQAIVSVIGTDMGRFPTDGHIASWAGLCPGNNESANRRKSGKTRKGNALLRDTLVVCAHSAVKNKTTYFSAQFARISAHRGKKRAYVAVAHSMLVAIYHIIKDGVAFKDLGADYYTQFNRDRKINAYLKKLKALGWEVPVVAA